jgi:hypothetical protein
MALRSFIRRAIQHVFFKVIYESEMHNGTYHIIVYTSTFLPSAAARALTFSRRRFAARSQKILYRVMKCDVGSCELTQLETWKLEKLFRVDGRRVDGRLLQHSGRRHSRPSQENYPRRLLK